MWYNVLYGSVAQLVEQRPEEPCVTGSSPVGTTTHLVMRIEKLDVVLRIKSSLNHHGLLAQLARASL